MQVACKQFKLLMGCILAGMKGIFGKNCWRLFLCILGLSLVFIVAGIRMCVMTKNSGAVLVHTSGASKGYVLISSYVAGEMLTDPGQVRLIDKEGHVVHEWKTKYKPLYSQLEPNGHVFVAMTPPIHQLDYPSGGTTGLIEELDWNGKVVWSYADSEMTHSFDVLPDGSVVYERWEQAPRSFASAVKGGMVVATTSVWTTGLVRIDKNNTTVWQWHLPDHLSASEYVLGAFTPRSDWSHINSVEYVADNPLTHTPAFLLSARHISEAFFIDAKTGKVLWQSQKGLFSMQHDATYLQNGNVMVFDNGFDREHDFPLLRSRAIEINPVTNEIVWQYHGGTTFTEQAKLESSIMGGAQRLLNGNTLITVSVQGRIIEITKSGQVVWEYVEPSVDASKQNPINFKSREYYPEGTLWGKWLPNFAFLDVLCH